MLVDIIGLDLDVPEDLIFVCAVVDVVHVHRLVISLRSGPFNEDSACSEAREISDGWLARLVHVRDYVQVLRVRTLAVVDHGPHPNFVGRVRICKEAANVSS